MKRRFGCRDAERKKKKGVCVCAAARASVLVFPMRNEPLWPSRGSRDGWCRIANERHGRSEEEEEKMKMYGVFFLRTAV